jgi:hypothetical protein
MSCKINAIDVLRKKNRNRGNTTQNKTAEVTKFFRLRYPVSSDLRSLILGGFPFCLHDAFSTYALHCHFQEQYQAQCT